MRSPAKQCCGLPSALLLCALAISLVIVFAGVCWRSRATRLDVQDFVEYWAAARVNGNGQNPYDGRLLYRTEHQVSPWLTDAIMMWNPPWMLVIVMPFARLPVDLGFALWVWVQLAILLIGAAWIGAMYGDGFKPPAIACLLALAFAPTWFLLRMGQSSALPLIGLIGFLHWEHQRADFRAGACLALAALKPHLLLPFAVAIVLVGVGQRRWRIFVGTAVVTTLLLIPPLLMNPQIVSQYLGAMRQRPPQMISPTLGALLRLIVAPSSITIQFFPALAAVAWVTLHCRHKRDSWNWLQQAPWLVLISMLAAPYGAWPFDLVLLLLPILQLASRIIRANYPDIVRFAVIALAGFNVLALLMNDLRWDRQYWFAWATPAVGLAYVIILRHLHCLDSPGNGSRSLPVGSAAAHG